MDHDEPQTLDGATALLEGHSVAAALRAAPAMLRHPNTQDAATAALLDRLALEEPADCRRMVQLLSAHGARTPSRTSHLLEVLAILPVPITREVLAFVPQLVGDTDAEKVALVETIKELIATDRTLMLPALGMLSEISLPESLKVEVSQLALGALPLADEPDLPTLVRCVLGTVAAALAGKTLRGMRVQLGSISAGTLALLLQVIGNRLRVNSAATRSLLTQCGSASALSRWDLLLLLQLLPMPRHREAATHAIGRALRRRTLSVSELCSCPSDPSLPPSVLSRLPKLAAALLDDTSAGGAASDGARLAVGLIAHSSGRAASVMAASASWCQASVSWGMAC